MSALSASNTTSSKSSSIHVGLLTAGHDKPYVVPLAVALAESGIRVDFIGSDTLACDQLTSTRGIQFLNLRGDQAPDASLPTKMCRLAAYYGRLLHYVATTKARVLHVIWNNKFETLDRTILMLYYRLMGKRVMMTAHNVNAAKRDGCDSALNRLTLRIQYRLCEHLFVHTEAMKRELCGDYGVQPARVSVIPFGMNDTVPSTSLSPAEARFSLGFGEGDKVLLFFGMMVQYKGLEDLVAAFALLAPRDPQLRLVIAGPVKRGSEDYWKSIESMIDAAGLVKRVHTRIEFVPDEEVEHYFKAADAAVLPYRHVFQSGVPFLAFNFGLPVIATDVGSLREDVVEGQTGFICEPRNPHALAGAIEAYFSSDLYRNLPSWREGIRSLVREQHSWSTIARSTKSAYASAGSRELIEIEAGLQ